MHPKVLFLGSIGAVAETSELQRQAYNQALAENDIPWHWTPEIYRDLLQSNGGQDRLRLLGQATGRPLAEATIRKIHARKTELAGAMIVAQGIEPRPGVVELIKAARRAGSHVGWVTTTYPANTNAILEACGDLLTAGDFDRIFHRTDVELGKPSSEVYHVALRHFGVPATDCVAVEDSLLSAVAAKGAGIYTIVTPGDNHEEPVENIADLTLDTLDQLELSSWFIPELAPTA